MAARASGCRVAALAVSVLLAGCGSGGQKPPVVTVEATPAQRAPISEIVATEGLLFPLQQAVITPKISAPVKKYYVNLGAKVHKGQLLVTLENQDLAAAAVENQGAYEQAQAEYQTATSASVPQQLQKAQVDLNAAKQDLDAQQKIYDARTGLYRQGAIPRKDLEAAKVALVQAQGAYEIALKQLQALQDGGTERALKSASGQLTAAKGRYLAAQAQLDYSEVRSPIEGVVTDRPLYPGEVAAAGSSLITVMNLGTAIAKAHIPADQAARLKAGDAATISAPGLDTPVAGKVTAVSAALDANSTTVEIWVQAANPKQELRPGSSVQLQMTARTIADALVIPASALLKGDSGKTTVMVVGPGNKAISREVETGIQQGNRVQILNGVRAGEQVITAGAYGLPDDTQVSVHKSSAESPQAGDSPHSAAQD